jgi:hypothetical protein
MKKFFHYLQINVCILFVSESFSVLNCLIPLEVDIHVTNEIDYLNDWNVSATCSSESLVSCILITVVELHALLPSV